LRLMVFGMATVGVAAVSWRFLEQPINRFRSREARAVFRPTAEMEETDGEGLVMARGLLP